MLITKHTSKDIFKAIELGMDELEQLSNSMVNQTNFRFLKQKHVVLQNRLKMFLAIGVFFGPQMLAAKLEVIKLEKILLVLDLEQGNELKVPFTLSQKNLPQSFRYYDPIGKITQTLCSEEKREFLSMQINLIRFFDKEFELLKILGLRK